MELTYMQIYSDLRSGRMSFHQFMDFVSATYTQGHHNGESHALSCAEIDALANARRLAACLAAATPARVEYEAVF